MHASRNHLVQIYKIAIILFRQLQNLQDLDLFIATSFWAFCIFIARQDVSCKIARHIM